MVDFFAIKPIFGRFFFFLLEIDLKTESMLIVLEWFVKVPVLLEQCFLSSLVEESVEWLLVSSAKIGFPQRQLP